MTNSDYLTGHLLITRMSLVLGLPASYAQPWQCLKRPGRAQD
jgi:hypothetical protein